MTYASSKTEDGKFHDYPGEGAMTTDPIAEGFSGCVGVAHIPELQKNLHIIGRAGYRHHVSLTFGHVADTVREAFSTYLGYSPTDTA